MTYCGSSSIVKNMPTHKRVYCLKCRSWQCEDCAPMRASQLRGLVRRGAPTRFLTLTIRFLDGDDPDAKARELARAWRLLRERIKKRFKVKKVSFLAVWEATKRGAPHLHIFLRGRFIRHDWLSEQMDDLIGSPVVSIEKIDNKDKAANYVTKYVTKANRTFNGCKRYWRSQDYEPPEKRYVKEPDPEGTYWTKSGGTDYQTVAGLVDAGWSAWPQKSYWILIPPGMDPPPEIGLGRFRKVS
jgi:hypothetical protein